MSDTTQLADQFLHECSVSPDHSTKISKGKSMSYVIDLNQGSYQSGIVTLDATNQLTGSQGYASFKDAYITIPFVSTLRNSGANAFNGGLNAYMAGMKCNTATIIDKIQIEINGKTIVTPSGYLSHWNNLRAMTEWSQDDVHKFGPTSMMYPDDIGSIAHATTGTRGGDGYSNNATHTTAVELDLDGTIVSSEKVCNDGFLARLSYNPPQVEVAGSVNNAFGWPSTIQAREIARATGRGATVLGSVAASSEIASFYYLHKIRLVDIHPIFKELDLCANPQLKLTLYINTGVATVDVSGTNSTTLGSVVLNQGTTCPVMLASAESGHINNALLGSQSTTRQLQLAWGVLGNPIKTFTDVSRYYPYTTTRMYIPFYDLQPERAMEIVKQPVKKSRFLDYYVQSFKGQAGEGVQAAQHNVSFSLQMSASIKNAKYVALLPFANTKAGNFATAHGTDDYASPFSSAPWTCQPGSAITNFNVQVGNKWIFNSGQNYDFEGFLNEFSKISALNGSLTHELSNGLIDEDRWSLGQRILVADVSRVTEKDVPQSLLITGTNIACQGVDFVAIVAYEREISLNRITGEVERFE